jgi:hypothetical protein
MLVICRFVCTSWTELLPIKEEEGKVAFEMFGEAASYAGHIEVLKWA